MKPPHNHMEQNTTKPQSFSGTVVKTAMKDTATVAVNRFVKHPKYKKYQVRTKKFLVHDPENTAKVGDEVIIIACKPVSKQKRFKIASITKTADAA